MIKVVTANLCAFPRILPTHGWLLVTHPVTCTLVSVKQLEHQKLSQSRLFRRTPTPVDTFEMFLRGGFVSVRQNNVEPRRPQSVRPAPTAFRGR